MVLSSEWIRRGITKFFDISLSDFTLHDDIDNAGSFNLNRHIKPKKNKKLDPELIRKHNFLKIENILLKGSNSISVYKTEKANGENVQISYSSKLQK